MRFFQLLVLTAALVSAGCFQATTLVKVNGDGSGTIEQTMIVTGAALAQLRQLAAFGGSSGKPFDPVSEEQARNLAATLGPTVTYVSSTPINTPDGQGRSMVYAFTDVSQLRVSQQPPAPGGVTVKSPDIDTANPPGARFELTHQPDGNAVLRITWPETKLPGFGAAPDGAPGQNRMSAEQIAAMKHMLAGARLAVAVEVAGQVVKASSPWVDGQRVTLMDVDFDQLLKEEGLLERMQSANSVEQGRALLKDVPGLKVTLDRIVTIEFTPKP